MTTTLYRFYDTEDRLLYVGISNSAIQRWGQHAAEKRWWKDVARTTVEHHRTRAAAVAAEREAIADEQPIHNIAHNAPPTPVPPPPTWEPDMKRLAYSPSELAGALGVTRAHIHNLISRGEIRSVKVGRCTRIPASEALRLAGETPAE